MSAIGVKKRILWVKHPEWIAHHDDNGVIFKPGTPQEILDSYALWKTPGPR